ncbi:alpha/beta hydrolase [Singulisphaera acidiphila]|uniref:alpha/beta hydrolase-fold protein n=1 Tax=Singulisphaera acidiphila TaxID=466153 RepID=UPI0002F47C69|nr:alpha/beta hydrolase-fold protein [Singulisphaera acidiphila]
MDDLPRSRNTGVLMNGRSLRGSILSVSLIWMGFAASPASAQPTFKKPPRYEPTAQETGEIETRLATLTQAIAELPPGERAQRDAFADVAIYQKAAEWALRLNEFFAQKDVAATLKVIDRGLERARQLADGQRPWAKAPGSSIRGYFSKVDGSVQPFALIVPPDLDNGGTTADAKRLRLDVVLHGRGETLNEVNFIQAHDGKANPADTDVAANGAIVLHVFGRTNNAYRWAGETDVFEAIAAVKRHYSIDDRRIVLRGFSMGGAGAWHLGLHHPSFWSSVEAGAGFSETRNYAKLEAIPEYEAKALRIYDAVDYAANAFNVPIVGYGGEDDPQRQAAINIEEALKTLGYSFKTEGLLTRGDGIDFLRVVGAKMGHKVDPASAKILKAFHDDHATQGANLNPKQIRFVTSTLKYNQAAWLSIEQLEEHYRLASVEAELQGNLAVVSKIENVAVLGVERHAAESIRLGEQEFPLEGAVQGLLPSVYFQRDGDEWIQLDYDASRRLQENAERGKRRNLQGPIDDAFSGSFLCVRGTGKPWNPHVQKWADARLDQFADDWRRWMRGEVRIKNDTEVTPEDIETSHLVLFGDPGSNSLLSRVVNDLPLGWSRTEIELAGQYRADNHAPVLIALNPLNTHRYVVVNSGHTFGVKEFAGTNALLFPHLGDYAVIQTDGTTGVTKTSGYFDESWKLKAKGPAK